ncbi:hypothetical protein KSP39_PZI005261 [Platanthera zijinensis]|uniref:Uncharacterized protein n=1 Tax=Platanthera zijinensis TaxID=2320716 RepID=A0AAP0GB08_9ASPA
MRQKKIESRVELCFSPDLTFSSFYLGRDEDHGIKVLHNNNSIKGGGYRDREHLGAFWVRERRIKYTIFFFFFFFFFFFLFLHTADKSRRELNPLLVVCVDESSRREWRRKGDGRYRKTEHRSTHLWITLTPLKIEFSHY